jgi:isocitrate/isopropylmalate dehydrogenase
VIPTVRFEDGSRNRIFRPATSEEGIRKYGNPFPPEAKKAIDEADCTLFGSTRGMAGGLGYLRWGKKTYANFRPVKWVKGMRSPLKKPDGIDFVVIRENLEGLYPKEGYERLPQLTDWSRVRC